MNNSYQLRDILNYSIYCFNILSISLVWISLKYRKHKSRYIVLWKVISLLSAYIVNRILTTVQIVISVIKE